MSKLKESARDVRLKNVTYAMLTIFQLVQDVLKDTTSITTNVSRNAQFTHTQLQDLLVLNANPTVQHVNLRKIVKDVI